MKKRKRNSQGAHRVTHGHYSGVNWTEYRYGEKRRPVTLAGPKPRPILKGEKREHVINEVMDRLRDWRLSPFEHEADCTHGLRQGLCMDGNSYSRSEQEAVAVVAEGLRLLGAKRPDWQEGQWEYAISPDYCATCHGPLDEADQARRRRFCSAECSRVAFEARGYRHTRKHNEVAQSAYYIIQADKAPAMTCAHCQRAFKRRNGQYEAGKEKVYCGKTCSDAAKVLWEPRECQVCSTVFKPRYERQMLCSLKCNHANLVKESNTTCEECGNGFRVAPSRAGKDRGKWCSQACRSAAMRKVQIPAECEWCGDGYMARNKLARFCCHQCKEHSRLYHAGRWEPVKMTQRAFDAFFTKPINDLPRPRRMTPQKLDWMFMEAGLRITGEARIAA